VQTYYSTWVDDGNKAGCVVSPICKKQSKQGDMLPCQACLDKPTSQDPPDPDWVGGRCEQVTDHGCDQESDKGVRRFCQLCTRHGARWVQDKVRRWCISAEPCLALATVGDQVACQWCLDDDLNGVDFQRSSSKDWKDGKCVPHTVVVPSESPGK
jgi:hypothetical protein